MSEQRANIHEGEERGREESEFGEPRLEASDEPKSVKPNASRATGRREEAGAAGGARALPRESSWLIVAGGLPGPLK